MSHSSLRRLPYPPNALHSHMATQFGSPHHVRNLNTAKLDPDLMVSPNRVLSLALILGTPVLPGIDLPKAQCVMIEIIADSHLLHHANRNFFFLMIRHPPNSTLFPAAPLYQ